METLRPALSVRELHPLSMPALAHVGDGVFELMVRVKLCLSGHPTACAESVMTFRREKTTAVAFCCQARRFRLTLSDKRRVTRGRV